MPNTRGYEDMQGALRNITSLAGSTAMPRAKFPNYLEQYRKKMNVGKPFPEFHAPPTASTNTDPNTAVGFIHTPMSRRLQKIWGA